MKTKQIFLFTTLLSFSINLFSQISFLSSGVIDSIKIVTVGFDIQTFVPILCEDFDSFFSKKKEIILTDLSTINWLQEEMEKASISKDKGGVNTRCKLYFYKKSDSLVVCMDQFCFQSENELYDVSSCLMKFINDIPEETWIKTKKNTKYDLFPGGNDSLYNYISNKNIFYSQDSKDTLRIFVIFNIDMEGNVSEIKIINRTTKKVDNLLMNSKLGENIINVFLNELKWNRSELRINKRKEVVPMVIYPQ